MQCYTELVAPSAVSHAVALPFLAPGAPNLVVAKTSLLQVFALKTVATDIKPSSLAPDTESNAIEGPDSFHRIENTAKLVLVGEYPLSGTVTSLQRVKALSTKTGAEALLIATQDAKISMIEWDPLNHRISTLSIHYYERETLHTLPFGPSLADSPSYLSVDPSSRCAALKFGTKHLAIIPFRQSSDDLVEDDHLGTPPPSKTPAAGAETPYSASFVLPLTALDPALTHPVHLAFLHEYREPTFGIVSSNKAASHGLLDERKDILNYTVFTLDLEQRASTTLLSVTGLPFDIFRVIPLPLPIGGALLVGANELVHVDQAGKTNAVALNEFAKLSSNFSMADQSDLGLRLEDCVIEALDQASGNMLIVLNTGRLAILSFRIDGRSVSGLSVHLVDSDHGGHHLNVASNCAASLGRGRIFLGSEDGDSTLLGWTKKSAQTSRKRSHAQMIAEDADVSLDEEDLDEDDDADDDLYADEGPVVKQIASEAVESSGPDSYSFRIHDKLFSLGPIKNVCLGKYSVESSTDDDLSPQLSLLASIGRGHASKLALVNRELTPSPLRTVEISQARRVWTACAKQAAPRGLPKPTDGAQNPEAQLAPDNQYDQYLVTSHADQDDAQSSRVFKIDNTVTDTEQGNDNMSYTEVTGTEFEGEGETLDVGVLASGTRIVQVRRHEIRSYDAGKSSISPSSKSKVYHIGPMKSFALLHTISHPQNVSPRDGGITTTNCVYGLSGIIYAIVYIIAFSIQSCCFLLSASCLRLVLVPFEQCN